MVLATLANEDEISLRRFNTANIVSNEYELFFRAKVHCSNKSLLQFLHLYLGILILKTYFQTKSVLW